MHLKTMEMESDVFKLSEKKVKSRNFSVLNYKKRLICDQNSWCLIPLLQLWKTWTMNGSPQQFEIHFIK